MHQTFIDLFLVLHQYFFIYANIAALIAWFVVCRIALFISPLIAVRIVFHDDCKAEIKQYSNTSHKQRLFVD